MSAALQMLHSRPGSWQRPAAPKRPLAPARSGHRSRRRVTGPWARLWAPELVVALWAVCWLWVRLHPTPAIPTPAPVTLAGVQAWWRSMVWPSHGEVAAQVALVVAVATLVVAADVRLLRCWRLGRRLRWRWERASRALNEAPRLRHVHRRGGVVDARVVLRGGNWSALETELDRDRGTMLRQLRLDRRMGSPVRAQILAEGCRNPARSRRLRLYYQPLPLPGAFPAWERPAQGAKVMVGHSVDGPVMVDLEGRVPHIRVVGGTGTGKGYLIRLLEVQVLRAGWLGVLLDGGNSPEHALVDPAPTFMRPMRSTMTVEERLGAAIVAVRVLKALADARSSIAEAFGATRWADIPGPVRAWLPRVAVVVDETTAMLAESKDPLLDNLRKALRTALDTDALRNGRKFGIHVLPLSDQFAYSGVFSKAAAMQAEGIVVLGNLAPEHVRQVTGLSSLPTVPDESRCGHFVRFGNPQISEIRVPSNHPDSLVRAVEYVVSETGGSS